MKITVIGKGNVGGALGGAWERAGHQVTYAGRGEVAAAVAQAEAVVNALPWAAVQDVLTPLDLGGKVLIDCTNPLTPDASKLEIGATTSGGEKVAEWAPGATVVKAFNTTGAGNMANPVYKGEPIPMFYCGDDQAAKAIAKQLIADVGFNPVDAGPLSNSRLLEPLALTWIWLAFNGHGFDFAFQIVTR